MYRRPCWDSCPETKETTLKITHTLVLMHLVQQLRRCLVSCMVPVDAKYYFFEYTFAQGMRFFIRLLRSPPRLKLLPKCFILFIYWMLNQVINFWHFSFTTQNLFWYGQVGPSPSWRVNITLCNGLELSHLKSSKWMGVLEGKIHAFDEDFKVLSKSLFTSGCSCYSMRPVRSTWIDEAGLLFCCQRKLKMSALNINSFLSFLVFNLF